MERSSEHLFSIIGISRLLGVGCDASELANALGFVLALGLFHLRTHYCIIEQLRYLSQVRFILSARNLFFFIDVTFLRWFLTSALSPSYRMVAFSSSVCTLYKLFSAGTNKIKIPASAYPQPW